MRSLISKQCLVLGLSPLLLVSIADAGTLTTVQTTDETGAPEPYRHEGIWRTEGDRLTIILQLEGLDADNLTPVTPPHEVSGTYTLTCSDADQSGDTIVSTYTRQ